jgi:hypothetical protein
MADVNAALAFKVFPTHTCFNGSRLGLLDAKTYVKASLAFQTFCQHLHVFNGGCEALLAFEIFPNTYEF